MKWHVWAMMAVLGAAVGCETTNPVPPNEQSEVNGLMFSSLRDSAIKNAIVTQHTLFPYHFEADSPELNELGMQDLMVLVEYAQRHSGQLTVRQGGVSDELYQERLKRVTQALADAKVQTARIHLTDGPAAGEGMPSETGRNISRDRNSPSYPLYYEDTGGESGGSGLFGSSESGSD